MDKVDNRTVSIKLAFPWGPLVALLAKGRFFVIPREAESQYDPKKEMRGAGLWILSEYVPGISFAYRRNPNYWEQDRVFLDGYDEPIVPEYATRLSQLRVKSIWRLQPSNSADLISVANDVAQMEIRRQAELSPSGGSMSFSQLPGSPFIDRRVRQAFSMTIDRDLFASVDSDKDLLAQSNIPRDYWLDLHIGKVFDGYLDPKDKDSDIGDGKKYIEYNLAEAKKLLAAAGHPDGFEVVATQSDRANAKQIAIFSEMLAQSGFKLKPNVVSFAIYASTYIVPPNDKSGMFEGFVFATGASSQATASLQFYNTYHSRGPTAVGRKAYEGQSRLDSMIEENLRELDAAKSKKQVQDILRFMAVEQPSVMPGYTSYPYDLVWPWLQDTGRIQGGDFRGSGTHIQEWYDATKFA
jgi:peptide/nickel transport system substrate-binding protein